MSQTARRILLWTPRVICIAFALFLSLFALDVFNEHLGFGGTLLALVMHMRWPGAVVLLLLLAWKWEWAGAVGFTALAVFYAVSVRGRFDWIVVISGPMLLVAALFLASWFLHASRPTKAA